jgi:hypothetical protein
VVPATQTADCLYAEEGVLMVGVPLGQPMSASTMLRWARHCHAVGTRKHGVSEGVPGK